MAKITCSQCGTEITLTCKVCNSPRFRSNYDGGIIANFKGESKTVSCVNCKTVYPATIYCDCGKKLIVPTGFF